jgi:hypothetical protein
MTDQIGPIDPKDRKMYEQEYRHSADLFKRALDEYSKSDDMFQQGEFKKVMDKAMQMLNETASGLMRKELMKQNQEIAKDYDMIQKYPSDPMAKDKLSKDLEKAKKSV